MTVVLSCLVVLLAALGTLLLVNALWSMAEKSARRRLDCLTCEDSGQHCGDCGPETQDDDLFTSSLFKVGASKRTISASRRARRDVD